MFVFGLSSLDNPSPFSYPLSSSELCSDASLSKTLQRPHMLAYQESFLRQGMALFGHASDKSVCVCLAEPAPSQCVSVWQSQRQVSVCLFGSASDKSVCVCLAEPATSK